MSLLRVSDYVKAPGFRLQSDGPNSGEWFRDTILLPALKKAIADHEKLTVQLDGVAGYGSSFLEEAFGGLVRNRLVKATDLDRYLIVVPGSPLFQTYRDLVYRFISRAESTAA